jgi:hypothetical protein
MVSVALRWGCSWPGEVETYFLETERMLPVASFLPGNLHPDLICASEGLQNPAREKSRVVASLSLSRILA